MAGNTLPAFPAHAQPPILRFWQEAHRKSYLLLMVKCYWFLYTDALGILTVETMLPDIVFLAYVVGTPRKILNAVVHKGPGIKQEILWASYQIRNIAGCACAGNTGKDFPATNFNRNHLLAIPAYIPARASRTCHDECRDR